MPVIDIGTIKGDDVVELPLQSLPHSLNAQHLSWKLRGKNQVHISSVPLPVPTTTQIYRKGVRNQYILHSKTYSGRKNLNKEIL